MDKKIRNEILEIVGAFIVAWLAYQILAAAAGTPLPIVSVVGNSMYHGPNDFGTMCGVPVNTVKNFDEYWGMCNSYYKDKGITKEEFRNFSAVNGLSHGDLSIVVKPNNPKIGDILVYRRFGSDFTVVHRLVEIPRDCRVYGMEGDCYITKGDNNALPDPPVAKQYVVGKFVFAVPLLGYPRLVLHLVGI